MASRLINGMLQAALASFSRDGGLRQGNVAGTRWSQQKRGEPLC